MDSKDVNPIGEIKEAETVGKYVQTLMYVWTEEQKITKPKWFQFWKKGTNLHKAVKFLLNSLDGLIDFVEGLIINGADKKATVLAAVDMLYDVVVKNALPLWLKPFASGIKRLIVYVIISAAIDFFVQKYREGAWKNNKETGYDAKTKI